MKLKLNNLGSFIRAHLHAWYTDLDAAQEFRSRSGGPSGFRSHNPHYLISMALFIFICLYGTFGLVWQQDPIVWRHSWRTILASRYSLVKATFPRPIWPQFEMVILICCITVVSSRLQFYHQSPIEPRYLIDVDRSQFKTATEEADFERIRRLRTKVTKLIKFCIHFITIFGLTIQYLHLYVNESFTFSWPSIIYWTVANPIWVAHIVNCMFIMPFYTILAGVYVRVQLESTHESLRTLNQSCIIAPLRSAIAPRSHRFKSMLKSLQAYQQFLRINRRLLTICCQLEAFARFWSPYLTIILSAFISACCYTVYACLLTDIPLIPNALLLSVISELICVIFALTDQCARVVRWNGRIQRQNRHFRVQFRREGENCAFPRQYLLKVEQLQNVRLLRSYAFRVFGNYRITSKTFYFLLSYISVFFLFICKRSMSN